MKQNRKIHRNHWREIRRGQRLRVSLLPLLFLLPLLPIPLLMPSWQLTGAATLARDFDGTDGSTLILLTEPQTTYTVGLHNQMNGKALNVSLRFNQSITQPAARLEILTQDVSTTYGDNTYWLFRGGFLLCNITDHGLTLMLGREFNELFLTSDSYYLQLLMSEATPNDTVEMWELTAPLIYVVLLCSLLPFFLLIPDVTADLQRQMDEVPGSHARFLGVLLPLLSIGVAVIALQILFTLFGFGGI